MAAESPVAVDGIDEMSAMAEQPEAMVCESLEPGRQNQGTREKTGTVSITKIKMIPPLSITAFGNYGVDVGLTIDQGVVINTVTLTTRPVVYREDQEDVLYENWNYYTWGPPSDNEPIVKKPIDKTGTSTSSFRGIRPDDIYPEIHFATDHITHNNPPEDKTIDQDNIQLMYFKNPFEMVSNTSFFIEFYAEPKNPNPPPPVPLDVYLVGSDVVSTTFQDSDWIGATNAELVGTIGRDQDFNHTHSEFSKHHVVFLSADEHGKVAGLDVEDNFWIVLTAGTSQDRRSWNLKYHTSGEGWECDNNGTWFKLSGTTVTQQTGCPDVHVHLARDESQTDKTTALVDGVEHLVEVSYTFSGVTNTITDTQYDYFGEIDNLAPNASSFTGPLAGVYSETFDITWNPARDPNNDPVSYNIYLYDIGTQTDVYTIATGHSGENIEFNTTSGDPQPKDGVYNIRIVACDEEGLCSSSFFLYDIYDIGDEFVIANNPFTWTGTESSDWDNASNWDPQTPTADDLAFIPSDATSDLIIGDGIEAQARRLSIAADRTVTIESGGKLEVTQSLVNEAGAANLVVEPGASLIHNTPWPSEGVPATVQQFIPKTTGDWRDKSLESANWYYIASPVGTQSISVFLDQLPEGDDYDLYRWGEEDDLWYNYEADGGVPENKFAHEVFKRGVGYLFAAQSDETFSYVGNLNSGDLEFTGLTRKGNGGSGEDEEALFDPGWNLVGNPYASGIKFDNDLWDSADESVALTPKYWDDSDGSYKVYEENDIIPPKTAFFVQVDPVGVETASFSISRAARAHPTAEKQQHNPNYIVLESSPVDGNTAQRAYVRRAPKASTSFDYRYDARFQPGYAPLFFSLKEEEKLQVHSISAIHDELVIPFYFLPNDEGPIFSISLLSNIEEQDLYLVDLQLDITHKLIGKEPYVFLSDPEDDPIRFELHFSPPEDDDDVGIQEKPDQARAQLWYHSNRLYVQTDESGTRLTIYDLNGRTLQTYRPEPGLQSYHINLPPGAYIARLNGKNTHETLKIITTNTL